MPNIYLDNAATTRIDERALEAMLPFLRENFGNASAKYYEMGKIARRAVLKARQQVSALINAVKPEDEDRVNELVFTACATESNNWVIKTVPLIDPEKNHIITSSIEHHSVLETCEFMVKNHGAQLTVLYVDQYGQVSPDDLRDAMRPNTGLVSIMTANNEVGTIQPVKELARIAHDGGALFHTDAVQAAGKIKIDVQDWDVDFLSLSGHKFHAPKGVGALYIRKGTRLRPFMSGGGQEGGRRAGTLNVAGIVGMGEAAEIAVGKIEELDPRLRAMTEKLWKGISASVPKVHRNGHPDNRLPNILNVRFEGAEGEAILLRLDMFGIQVASGSACSTGDITPSHVLMAMGIPQEDVHGSIRFSLSRDTTDEDIEKTLEILPAQVQLIRDMSVTWNG